MPHAGSLPRSIHYLDFRVMRIVPVEALLARGIRRLGSDNQSESRQAVTSSDGLMPGRGRVGARTLTLALPPRDDRTVP